MTTDAVIAYADSRFDAFLNDLKGLARIPSVSFDGFDPAQVERSAEAVAELCRARGLENVEILRIPGAHPYVYADWLHAPGRPTLLLYAHHDVQPPGREALWLSPPFEPTERNSRLYGRGCADDKAGAIAHLGAIVSWLGETGSLPLNIKLIIEGEEETGSGHLEAFLADYAPKLKADAIVLTDTGNFDTETPAITVALRGLVVVDVTVRSMDHPLHSGIWGGPVPDPVQALAKMIAACTDDAGRMTIPGVYDDVAAPGAAAEASLADAAVPETLYREQAGIYDESKLLVPESELLRSNWYQPSLSVNAIEASSREDVANIINDSAWAHLGVRLAPGMDPDRTLASLKAHLQAKAPWGVRAEFSNEHTNPAWTTDTDAPAFAAARRALQRGYGRAPIDMGSGGSIPFVGPFSRALDGAPALLIGVEDPLSNPHSENESLHLGMFRKAIASAAALYGELAALDSLR